MNQEKDEEVLNTEIYRIIIIGFTFIFFIGGLIYTLWSIQVKGGSEYIKKISKQSIRTVRLPSIRGRIFTSDGHILADNVPSYDIFLHIAEVRKSSRSKTVRYIKDSIDGLFLKLDRLEDFTDTDIINHMYRRPAIPMKVLEELSDKELGQAYEMIADYPGIEIVTNYKRNYPENNIASHIIGYVRPETPPTKKDVVRKIDYSVPDLRKTEGIIIDDDKINIKEFFYFIPNLKGKSGIEAAFNDEIKTTDGLVDGIRGLTGEPGVQIVKVDNRGYSHEILENVKEVKDGNNIYLTLDWKAQKIAEDLFKDKVGAFVLVDADNGDILSMVSAPSYNLKDFYPSLSSSKWKKILANPMSPMINRATGGQTPGSIVKPIVSLALLRNGVTENEHLYCRGETKIGRGTIECWSYKDYRGIGKVDIKRAIEKSCNKFFIENSLKHIDISTLNYFFTQLGLGQKTGLPIYESSGLLPSEYEKNKRFGTSLTKFDTAMTAIGQGLVLVSPIQAAIYAASLANGGDILEPRLLKEVRDSQGNILYRSKKKIKNNYMNTLGLTNKEINIVKKGMERVVYAPQGGGKNARNNIIKLYGKTGTAELGGKHKNTWFITYGKHKKKNYAACIYIYDGESGGKTCAPIAKEFFTKYLK